MKIIISSIGLLSCLMIMAQTDEFLPTYAYPVQRIELGDAASIAYLDEGPENGPVLLMVHGLGGYIKNWYPTIEGLKEKYRCIALDLPGYGLSTIKTFESEDYMEFFATTVMDFVAKLKLKEVVMIGHSMGGQVSIVTALKQPKWLDKLILAAPAGLETFNEQEAAALKQFASAELLMNHTEAQIRAAYQANFVNMPDAAEDMIQDRLKAKQAPWFGDYAKVREMGVKGMLDHPVKDQLSGIDVPTLIIFGKNDLLIPNRYLHVGMTTEQVAEIGRSIPNVDIKLIEAAGHMLQMDNPQRFNLIVNQYLME